jgi:hypothetical protein
LDFLPSLFSQDGGQAPENFDYWLHAERSVDPGAPMGYEAFENSNSNHLGQPNPLDQSLLEATTSLPQPNTPVDAYQFGDVADSMPDALTSFVEGTWSKQSSQSMQTGPSATTQVIGQSEEFPTSTMVQPSSFPQQTSLPSQISMSPVQAENPILNADGKMICNYSCSNTQTFERRCDWQ